VSFGSRKHGVSKAVIFACLAASGASYALDVSSSFHKGETGSKGSDVVIAGDQTPAFLAYVKRQKMRSDPLLKPVSVGDVLPDSGVRYYEIPLYYGAPFYRYAVIGEEVVIVDPTTRRVFEVIE
jgi:hypothetical protein